MAVETPFDKMVQGVENNEIPSDLAIPEDTHASLKLANFSSELDMESEDLMIPRLRLMQGLSTEVQEGTAFPGKWVLTGFDPKDELVVIPCLFARNRTLRDTEGQILCRSLDSLTGVGEPGGECAKCIMNQWKDGPDNTRLPPPCSFSYAYIVYVPEFKSAALVEFRRTSLQAGKTLNTFAAQKGLTNFAIKLRSSKQTGKRGTFFQIVVQPTQVSQEVLAEAKAFINGEPTA
jgi:hypothetical protein